MAKAGFRVPIVLCLSAAVVAVVAAACSQTTGARENVVLPSLVESPDPAEDDEVSLLQLTLREHRASVQKQDLPKEYIVSKNDEESDENTLAPAGGEVLIHFRGAVRYMPEEADADGSGKDADLERALRESTKEADLAVAKISLEDPDVPGAEISTEDPDLSAEDPDLSAESHPWHPESDEEQQNPWTETSSGDDDKKAASLDRYPAIFNSLKDLLPKAEHNTVGNQSAVSVVDEDNQSSESNMSTLIAITSRAALKLLSFGCADGTECRNLRKYFPDAQIHGVDLDTTLISQNTEDNADPLIQYFDSTTELNMGTYDAVLAMDTLCSQSDPPSHMSHQNFTNAIHLLDRLVRPGGYLVLYNANYPLSEFAESDRYENMATGCDLGRSPTVLTADQSGMDDPHWGDWKKRGQCTSWGKHCIESGWREKLDSNGEELQPVGHGMMSFGCMYPGPIFKKLHDSPADADSDYDRELSESDYERALFQARVWR